jgi:transposase InsO family protein
MEAKESVEKKPVREPRAGKQRHRYRFEEKLRAVRLVLQEGFSHDLVCKETGVASSSLSVWLRDYRAKGEAGLQGQTAPRPGRRLPEAITERILQLKRANRWYGVKRIADTLRRLFFLPASPETVRRRLHEAGLMDRPPKARRNLTRPRFFERATPNQMWQSDLFTFKLGGKYAYVVAFMDDYSRFIVGLDLYRSPTAEAVIETYRVAVGEYSPPKEMLTDRGRQYTNWRGKSRFAVELQKDRVAHIVSRPQHPMTLGKVERFWASMWQEFLVRAQFDSFEQARERLRLWVKYYNHRRPHQGIGAMCPADRYFEIASELKKTIQAGIQENLLELALRGQPKSPFYLVGRLDGQSVVLKAEKGKLKLSVNEKEMTYELEKGSNGGDETREAGPAAAGHADQLPGGGESAGGAGGVDRPGETGGGDAGAGDQLHHPPAVAGAGDGGDVAGPREPGEPDGRGGAVPAPESAPAEAPAGGRPGETLGAAGAHPGSCPGVLAALECLNHAHEREGAVARGSDHEGTDRAADGDGRGGPVGGLAQNLLRVGGARAGGDVGEPGGPDGGEPAESGVAGASGPAGEGGRPGEGALHCQADRGNPGGLAGDGAEGC